MQRECEACGKQFRTYPSRIRIGKGRFCGERCSLAVIGFSKGHTPWSKCKRGVRYSPSTEFKKGLIPWNKGFKTGIKHAKQFKKGLVPWNKGLKGFMGGEVHWNWRGGAGSLRKKLHETFEYRQWRKAVLKRDNHTCQICGSTQNIEADHIKRWKEYPELRHELSNGRALCRPCHTQTPTYGNYRHGRYAKRKTSQC